MTIYASVLDLPPARHNLLFEADFTGRTIPKHVLDRATFTRPSNATYWDDGRIYTAGPDVPVIDYSPISKMRGLLIEGAAMNRTTIAAGSGQVPTGAPIGAGVYQVPTLGPDGLMSAVRLSGSGTSVPLSSSVKTTSQVVTLQVVAADDPAGDGTFTVSMRNSTTAVTAGSVTFNVRTGAVTNTDTPSQDAYILDYGEWKVCVVELFAKFTPGDTVQFYFRSGPGIGKISPIRLWRTSVDTTQIASSFIPPVMSTEALPARAAAELRISEAGITDYNVGYHVVMEYSYVVSFRQAVSYGRMGQRLNSTNDRMEVFMPAQDGSSSRVVNSYSGASTNTTLTYGPNVRARKEVVAWSRAKGVGAKNSLGGQSSQSSVLAEMPAEGWFRDFVFTAGSSQRIWLHNFRVYRGDISFDDISRLTKI